MTWFALALYVLGMPLGLFTADPVSGIGEGWKRPRTVNTVAALAWPLLGLTAMLAYLIPKRRTHDTP
jgi:hypothetical protein